MYYVIWVFKNKIMNEKPLFWKSRYVQNIAPIIQLIKEKYEVDAFEQYSKLCLCVYKYNFKDSRTHTFINTEFHVSKHRSHMI